METISIVIPCYCSEKTLPDVINETKETIKQDGRYQYQFILVNDSSPDGGQTWAAIQKLCAQDANIQGIDLSKNFGQHSAILAGLKNATGDIFVSMDDDGQTPGCEIFKLINAILNGYDFAVARFPQIKQPLFRKIGTCINNWMSYHLIQKPKNIRLSSYVAFKKFLRDTIIQYPNSYPYVAGLLLRATNRVCNVDIPHRKRAQGKSGYNFKKLFSLWINGFTAFSVKPLRVATFFGAITAIIGFGACVFVVIQRLLTPSIPMGYSSIVALLLFIGGTIMLTLGMLGEYIGRIYISLNKVPQSVIREQINIPQKPTENETQI